MSATGGGRTRRPGGKTSIYDVAELAGVSHQTVSRVINGHPNIRDATRARVEQAMAEIDYHPSGIARALATSRTRRIGVIVDSPVQYGPSSTVRAIEEAAVEAGYGVNALSGGDDVDLDRLRIQEIDALCVIAPRYSTLSTLRARASGVPLLLVKADPEHDVLAVAVDQYAGAVHAVDHLLELGHRRILHVGGPRDWADARVRARAYSERLAAEGLDPYPPILGDWTSDFGYRIGKHPTVIPAEVTAVFAANDQMALGLVHGLHERGIRVPSDISVVGFDDLPDARHFLPPLTTVRQDFHALGTLALTTLIDALEGRATPLGRMIEPELVVRASTAPPRR